MTKWPVKLNFHVHVRSLKNGVRTRSSEKGETPIPLALFREVFLFKFRSGCGIFIQEQSTRLPDKANPRIFCRLQLA